MGADACVCYNDTLDSNGFVDTEYNNYYKILVN